IKEKRLKGAVKVYSDVASAFNEDVRRPGFERLVGDVESGEITDVCVWHTDRLVRQVSDGERLVAFMKRGLRVHSVHDTFAAATPEEAFMTRVLVTVAQHESENTQRRVKAAHARIAAEGRHSGGPRMYGYPA